MIPLFHQFKGRVVVSNAAHLLPLLYIRHRCHIVDEVIDAGPICLLDAQTHAARGEVVEILAHIRITEHIAVRRNDVVRFAPTIFVRLMAVGGEADGDGFTLVVASLERARIVHQCDNVLVVLIQHGKVNEPRFRRLPCEESPDIAIFGGMRIISEPHTVGVRQQENVTEKLGELRHLAIVHRLRGKLFPVECTDKVGRVLFLHARDDGSGSAFKVCLTLGYRTAICTQRNVIVDDL